MTRLARPAVLLSCALAIPLAACGEAKKTQAESTETAVQVVRITENAGVSALRDYAGIIRPRREADMAFRAGGRIIARDVDLGARVRQGQTLARLDPADLSLQKRSAEADLASAEAQAVQALADGRRSSQLLAGGWASNQADETKQAMAKAAQERVISARAALQLARNRLDYAVLTAPRDGVITATLADPGTVVSEGQPVLRLAETGALEIHAYDQEDVVAGQGTVGRELETDAPGLTHVLVATGGGGLIGGIAAWYAGSAAVVSVEPEGCPTLHNALLAAQPVDAPVGGLAADSLGARRVGGLMFPLAQAFVQQAVLVPDDAIAAAQRLLWEQYRLIAEPGGATALAGLLSGRFVPPAGARVGVVVCGGNTDPGKIVTG